MPTQMESLLRRRMPSNAAAAIQAKIPYLYQKQQQKADTAYQDKVYAQNERALAQQTATDARSLDLAERAQEQQREANEQARKAGVAGLGLQSVFGLQEYGNDLGGLFGLGGDDAVKSAGSDAAKAALSAPSTAGGFSGNAMDYLRNYKMGDVSSAASGASDGFSLGNLGSKLADSLLKKNTLSGIVAGQTIGPAVADVVPFGGPNEKEIIADVGVGALTPLVFGGDWYDSATSALTNFTLDLGKNIFKW